MSESNKTAGQAQGQATQAQNQQTPQAQGQAAMMNHGMNEAPAYAGQQGAEQGGYQAQQQHQHGHGGHGAHGAHGAQGQAGYGGQGGQGNMGMPGGYPAYYCAPAPTAPAGGAMPAWEQTGAPQPSAMPQGGYTQPAPAYPPHPQYAPQMGGHPHFDPLSVPHPGYMPMPQQPPMQQPYHPAYGYAPPAGQSYPYAAQQQAHDSGLSSFFNFRDERFVKGAVTGAALTFLLTNESLQKNTLKSVVKFWNMLQGGVEEMKERIQDIDAEIKAEDQK